MFLYYMAMIRNQWLPGMVDKILPAAWFAKLLAIALALK